MKQTKKPRTLRACKANPGIRAAYRRKLEALIDEMRQDVESRILAEYEAMEPRIAHDWTWRSPAARLEELMDGLVTRWMKKFSNAAMTISSSFLNSVRRGVQRNRRQSLLEAGVGGIKFNKSRFANEQYEAMLAYNVHLIKTIPTQYLDSVQEQVQRAVSNGLQRDELAKELTLAYDVSYKRAKVIARDQTNKATQALARATDEEIGITEGVWVHIPGRFTSRQTHIEMNGQPFKLAEGMFDPDPKVRRNIMPGELVLCACQYRPVLPENWGVTV